VVARAQAIVGGDDASDPYDDTGGSDDTSAYDDGTLPGDMPATIPLPATTPAVATAPSTPALPTVAITRTIAGTVARMRTDDKAAIPRGAPRTVQEIIATANRIIGKPTSGAAATPAWSTTAMTAPAR